MTRSLIVLCLPVLAFAQQIVYTHAPEGGKPWPVNDIYTMNADGSQVKPLTNDGHSHDPAWSPAGDRVLFIHDSELQKKAPYRDAAGFESHHAVELSVMDRDGRNRHVLRRIEPVIYSAAWSPDGKTLAITCGMDPAARRGLYLLNASGEGEPRLLFAQAFTPAWSPDGRSLAFSVEQPRGEWSVHVANADGTGDRQLTEPGRGGGSPAWSPDGKTIAFSQRTFQVEQVFTMNPDGSRLRQVTDKSGWSCNRASWSPDGTHLAVSCRTTANHCGMGISSVGTPLAPCDRRVFIASPEGMKPTTEHDAAQASFSPSR